MKTIVLCFVFFTACNADTKQATTPDSSKAVDETVKEEVKKIPENNDSTIYVRFGRDSTGATVSGDLRKNQPVSVLVDVNQGQTLTAELTTVTPKLNARINQLFTPKGKADGPFGNRMEYAIHEKGMYKMIVGSNLMAEGLLAGRFELRVTVR